MAAVRAANALQQSLWPSPSDPLWQSLEADGLRVTNDIRRISPPIVILIPVEARLMTGCVYEIDYDVTAVAPGPEHADALSWLWGTAAKSILKHAPSVQFIPFNDFPAIVGEVTVTVEVQ